MEIPGRGVCFEDMEPLRYPVLILLASAVVGWLLAGSGTISASKDGASRNFKTSARREVSAQQDDPGAVSSGTTALPDQIPISKLEGLASLKGSPRLSAGFWVADGDEISDPAFPHLVDWLELSESQRKSLAGIIREAAWDRRDWERTNMRAERVEAGIYRLDWIDYDLESLSALKKALSREFGETLGNLIYLRGNLHRFFEPVPGWKQRGVSEIGLRIEAGAGGGISLVLSNGDWSSVIVRKEKKSRFEALPRLDHLFEYQSDAEPIFDSNKPRDYQVAAAVPGKPGFVLSPYSGTVIDVRGIPPGTLAQDPTRPTEEKAYFRVPKENSDE